MAKKVLVTGAAGLIGREILAYCIKNNFDVLGIDNCSRFDYVPDKNFIKTDIDHFVENNVNNFDVVYHMAAINGTTSFYETPNKVLKENVIADLKIFEFVEKNPNTKLIYASSSEVVAGTSNFPTAEENNVLINDIHNARWSYRLPKIMSENYLMNSNINFLIVRFFNVISENAGPGHFIYDISKKIKSNNFEIIGPDETRSFCYTADAVNALMNVEHLSNDVINIGSDEEITIAEASDIIAEALGVTVDHWKHKNSLRGSSKRRKPNVSKLRKHYPAFNPLMFKDIVEKIKDKL